MKSYKINTIVFGIIIGFFSLILGVSAVSDFTMSPTTISNNVNVSTLNSGIITITNTGTEVLNLTLSDNDLTSGGNSFPLNLNVTSIINLNVSESTNISYNYNTGSVAGTYTGIVTGVDTSNSSINDSVTFSIVTSVPVSNAPSVMFRDLSSVLTIVLNVDDSSQRKSFYLVNNGNSTINNIEFKLNDLRGNNDRINNNDVDINGESGDRTFKVDDNEGIGFELLSGDSYKVVLNVDIPSNLNVDDYRGDFYVYFKSNGVSYSKKFQVKVVAESNNENVYIRQNSLYVKNGLMKIFAEPGEYINDNTAFIVVNDASHDVNELSLGIENDFTEENSANIMSKSVVKFIPSTIDINDRNDESIDLEINIPDNQPTGIYKTDIILYSKTGKKLDKIALEIEVIGDIYIKKLNYDNSLKPGDYLDVEVVVSNKGTAIQRNVKITGSLFDVDYGNSDIHESSSNFLLESDSDRTETLRFKLPKDASDGSHILEIKVRYGDNELTKIENVDISRPSHMMNIESFAINPRVAKCDDSIYTYMKLKNFGKYSEDVKFSAEIIGTNILTETNTLEIGVDEVVQKSLILDISNLDSGSYKVVQKVIYGGSLIKKEESNLRIDSCQDASVGVTIGNNLNNQSLNNSSSDVISDSSKLTVFGNKVEKTTAYLGMGVGGVFLLIIFALFLL